MFKLFILQMTGELYFRIHCPLFNITLCLLRSPEAKKRKATSNTAEATNGPSAKKAKASPESSSSEESSSDEEEAAAKPTKAAPAGRITMFDRGNGYV